MRRVMLLSLLQGVRSIDRISGKLAFGRSTEQGGHRMATAKTPGKIMESARDCLLATAKANIYTRMVAARACVPLSQLHYHFGGNQGRVLVLVDYENHRLDSCQRQMSLPSAPFWKRYEQA